MAMEGITTSGAFTGAILAEKLTKLNVTQQSIETLSHWCIFHRKKAREIVETWAKKFHGAPREQSVPFLYLANDILQNSRRKGPEFVNEFWTVLPRVLRDIVDSGDEAVQNAAYRLVDIWEERRVFGTRAQSLREELLGKRPQLSLNEARHNSIIPSYQMIEGSMLERVARSYHAVQEKSAQEHGAMSKYYAAVSQIENLKKEAEGGAGNGGVQASIADELLEQQSVVRQSIEQFEGCEISHALLCTYLKDFLLEQERNLEQVRAYLQIAKAQLEQVGRTHHRVTSPKSRGKPLRNCFNRGAATATVERSSPQPTSAAAEVAAKLTASSSSAAVFTTVLSSLAAEEKANDGVQSPNGGRALEKRPRVEVLDNRSRAGRPKSAMGHNPSGWSDLRDLQSMGEDGGYDFRPSFPTAKHHVTMKVKGEGHGDLQVSESMGEDGGYDIGPSSSFPTAKCHVTMKAKGEGYVAPGTPDPSLPPPMVPYLSSAGAPLPRYQSTLPPPPPLQGRVMVGMGLPYYSKPPLPAPPAPAPRQ